MLVLKESDYKPIEEYLLNLLYDTFYKPTLAIIKHYWNVDLKLNAVSDVLTSLERGDITFIDNQFKGKFNVRVSKELSKFAAFDERSKTWKVKDITKVPSSIKAKTIEVNRQVESMQQELNLLYANLQDRFEANIELELVTPFEDSLKRMEKELGEDFKKIGIQIQITPEQRQALLDDYNNNQSLNIKNWNFEQVQRLRDIVTKMNVTGFSKLNLKDFIESEFEVTTNKARFLARQETSLFLAKFRREQSKGAGVKKYKWSTSKDERVRPADGTPYTRGPNHKRLQGQIFFYGDPPIVDTRTGRTAEPGEDFNCRCVAIPILD